MYIYLGLIYEFQTLIKSTKYAFVQLLRTNETFETLRLLIFTAQKDKL